MAEQKNYRQSELEGMERRLDIFEYLKSFINIELNTIADKELLDIARSHVVKVIGEQANSNLIDLLFFNNVYAEIVKNSGYIKLRKYLAILQYSLIEAFDEVKKQLNDDELISFNGSARLVLNHVSNRYELKFLPFNFKFDKNFDIAKDCEVLRAQFFEIISYLMQDNPFGRLKVCKKCAMLFFQITGREKIFCSPKCSKAAAQAQYVEREKNKEDDNKKNS